MKHLIICREYPPAPGGGIGVYCEGFSQLLAEHGETVHVISQLCEGAERSLEKSCEGRLVIHRLPYDDWTSLLPGKRPFQKTPIENSLFTSEFPAQCFSWKAASAAEKLVEEEQIDIIEAPDYEAPLYYFQLRRALGLGPTHRPPCFVHLHSPTEFIAEHNDWDLSQPSVLTAKRLELFSITGADALLCPSHFLARQVQARYGLERNSIEVIRYPLGDSQFLERERDTWSHGSICYVGRLERRKGVVEFVDAAVSIARQYSNARFAFAGADTLDDNNSSVRAYLERLIPRELKSRFRFHGNLDRSSLSQLLAKSRIGVVPSRWENFPNSCIEAMASGLPVIASQEGGMAEVITDGRTGWLAESLDRKALEAVLKQGLDTPASRLAEMGREAAAAVAQICNNEQIVEKQLEFRRRLVEKGAQRSLSVSTSLPLSKSTNGASTAPRTARDLPARGITIVVTVSETEQSARACLQSIERQTTRPAAVVIIANGLSERQFAKLDQWRRPEWQLMRSTLTGTSGPFPRIASVLDGQLDPLGCCLIRPQDVLEPNFVAECLTVLERCPEVGIVSCWTDRAKATPRILTKPCPSFPFQWLANDAAPFSVIRTEALREAGDTHLDMKNGNADWYLVSAVMAAGWVAVTLPNVLVRHPRKLTEIKSTDSGNDQEYLRMRASLLEQFPHLAEYDETRFMEPSSSSRRGAPLREQIALMGALARYPRTTGTQFYGRLRSKLKRHAPLFLVRRQNS
jgi:glycogen synthase